MEAQDSCKSQGKQEWKVARGDYNTENVDRSGGFDNNYCCIARGIWNQIEVPDKAKNRNGLRTE